MQLPIGSTGGRARSVECHDGWLCLAGRSTAQQTALAFRRADVRWYYAEVTIATWVKLKTLTTWQRVIDVGINAGLNQNTSAGTVYMTFVLKDFSNNLGFSATKDGYSSAQLVSASSFATATWKHVAVVLGASGGTLYVDGVSAGSNSALLAPQGLGALDDAFIGKSQFSGDPLLDAQIDEFRVYRRALSASEIEALFKYTGP